VRRAIFLDSAMADQSEILEYITHHSQSLRVGQRFMRKLYAHCDHLASLPFQMGISRSDLGQGLRCSAFEGYVIFFRYQQDRFEVVNILEGHRDIPEYFSETKAE
jgi:toxin ParE1/3/4